MLGLGETDDEIVEVMRDLRAHDVDMLTLGQYLQPSAHHLPVLRYAEPAVFDEFEQRGKRTRLRARRVRAAGALELSCRPAGARSGGRLTNHGSAYRVTWTCARCISLSMLWSFRRIWLASAMLCAAARRSAGLSLSK